jgi:cytoskeletal protein RodZ
LNEIGESLRGARESSGVSLEEAGSDLKIKPVILENIENGNIGCFKDIFELKDYLYNYAKYLGINPDKTIDKFNEYLFEYTSKIPVTEIEKKIVEIEKKWQGDP